MLKKAVGDKNPEGTFPDKGRRTTRTGAGSTNEAVVEQRQSVPTDDAYLHDFHVIKI